MIPGTFLGVAILLGVIAPGYAYLRVAERRGVRPGRSPVLELAELAVSGTIATVASVVVVLFIGSILDNVFVDLAVWARSGSTYVANNATSAARCAAAVFILSLIVAGGMAW